MEQVNVLKWKIMKTEIFFFGLTRIYINKTCIKKLNGVNLISCWLWRTQYTQTHTKLFKHNINRGNLLFYCMKGENMRGYNQALPSFIPFHSLFLSPSLIHSSFFTHSEEIAFHSLSSGTIRLFLQLPNNSQREKLIDIEEISFSTDDGAV